MREVKRWHSPALGREMGVGRWGTFGKPVLFFPTGGGDFLDCERFLMTNALTPLIEAGRIKLYAVDSTSRWGWANRDASPSERVALQAAYDRYLTEELFPWIRADSGGTDQKFAVTGASLGAYNAWVSAAKHPEQIDLCVGMSGSYVHTHRMHGFWNEDWYFNDPTQFVPNLPEDEPLRLLRRDSRFVFALGEDHENPAYTEAAYKTMADKGIPAHLVRWHRPAGHDWPTWRTMLPAFLDALV